VIETSYLPPAQGRDLELAFAVEMMEWNPGTYEIRAVVDAGNAIQETDEFNNELVVVVTLIESPAGLPDLQPIEIDFTPTDPSDEPVPPECTCEPTGERSCRPLEIACEDDSACPAGWTCEQSTADVPCTYDPTTGETVCDDPVDPGPGQCTPPYWGWTDDAREGGLAAAEYANGDGADGRGCQAAPGAAGGGLVGLLLLAALRARRRVG